MEKIIDLKNVNISHEDGPLLSDVNFSMDRGEFVYLIGKSGAGKTSLLRALYADKDIDSGLALVCDTDVTNIRKRKIPLLRRKIGIVFQNFRLLNDRTVFENLNFVLRATGWKDKQLMKNHVSDILSQVGMEDKAYKMPYHLSGGEQQRVAIARALLNTPEVILADEPTGNLDLDTGREIMELLYSIRKAGMTIIMSTHNRLWPEEFPGRKLVFAGGKVSECE